ncbi:MAG TPA: hypothetical protein DCM87_01775 [Planctomycetes bacterium]|nr:hypothetical protein [Planctomycetota bacterium]
MRKAAFVCVLAWLAVGRARAQEDGAASIIEQHLRTSAETTRRALVAKLEAMPPDEVARGFAQCLARAGDAGSRNGLAETLGRHFQTKEAAAVLRELLADPDERVRGTAIHGLRMMARRTDRPGHGRVPRGADFAPKVEGLVPALAAAAAKDASEMNRVSALYALADTRDAAAPAALRSALGDPSPRVRLFAACFLTEYADATGLAEMRSALEQLRVRAPEKDVQFYWDAGILLASMERITGKSFGPVPMNPGLSSDLAQAAEFEARYKSLIATWSAWWAWEPAAR